MQYVTWNSILCVLVVLALGISANPSITAAAEVNSGRELYLKHCSSCHGEKGMGNGPVSQYLSVTPTDLTLLKQKNGGIYPLKEVMTSIDGSRTVRGHGHAEMPVWGEVFRKELEGEKYRELTSLLKTKAIAEFIATLQR